MHGRSVAADEALVVRSVVLFARRIRFERKYTTLARSNTETGHPKRLAGLPRESAAWSCGSNTGSTISFVAIRRIQGNEIDRHRSLQVFLQPSTLNPAVGLIMTQQQRSKKVLNRDEPRRGFRKVNYLNACCPSRGVLVGALRAEPLRSPPRLARVATFALHAWNASSAFCLA